MQDITLTILAGGESSRMGSSKSELALGGQSVLGYLLDRIKWIGPTMLITAPGSKTPTEAERFDLCVCDPVAGVGPLRGILTALENAPTTMVVVIAVDMPSIDASQVKWVGEQLIDRPDALGILMSRDLNGTRQIEPFPSAYRVSAKSVLVEQLARQRRAVHGLSQCPGFVTIDAPRDWPIETWRNLNTPGDLEAFHTKQPPLD